MSGPVEKAENIQAVLNDLAFEAIVECCDIAASCAMSAREAAWRGDRRLVEIHLRELRQCLLTAIDARNRLGKPEAAAHA